MVIASHKGRKFAFPAGAPLVYTSESITDDLEGGSAEELASDIVAGLCAKLELPREHLSYLQGEVIS